MPRLAAHDSAMTADEVETMLGHLERMTFIRRFEEEVQRQFLRGAVPGTTHLCNGHEAVSVGLAAAMRDDDVIATTYRGWDVYELPPNTQGIAALMMLNVMEQFPLAEYGLHSARSLHAMIEAKKLAYADMLRYAGDPRFGDAPLSGLASLLSKAHSRERASLIDPMRALRTE